MRDDLVDLGEMRDANAIFRKDLFSISNHIFREELILKLENIELGPRAAILLLTCYKDIKQILQI